MLYIYRCHILSRHSLVFKSHYKTLSYTFSKSTNTDSRPGLINKLHLQDSRGKNISFRLQKVGKKERKILSIFCNKPKLVSTYCRFFPHYSLNNFLPNFYTILTYSCNILCFSKWVQANLNITYTGLKR